MTEQHESPLARCKAALAAVGRLDGDSRPDDAQLLQILAFYDDRSPSSVLRLAAWKAGDGSALTAYRKGEPLPRETRRILDEMLQSHLSSEHEAAALCESAASGMTWLSLDFLALAAVLLLFIG
jgi:hypothetical protein